MSEPGRRSLLDAQKDEIAAWISAEKAIVHSQICESENLYGIRRGVILTSLSLLEEEHNNSKASFQRQIDDLNALLQEKLDEVSEKERREKGATVLGRLPVEIFGYIFQQCVEGDLPGQGGEGLGTSPWTLALVCRFWYRTVLGTPSLWCKILITNRLEHYWDIRRHRGVSRFGFADSIRRHSAMQICLNKNELTNALKRSGAAPLEITLDFDQAHRIESLNTPELPFYEDLFKLVFNDRVAPRISRIVGGISGFRWGLYQLPLGLISGLSSSLPNLASLQIDSLLPFSMSVQGGKPMLKAILEGAKRLQEVDLGAISAPECLRCDTWRLATYSSTISNLRELRVQEASILDDVLGGELNTEAIRIEGPARVEKAEEAHVWEVETSPWPTTQTPEITFQCISRLHLICDDFSLLGRLKFPALQEFRLTQSASSRRPRAGSTETSNLLSQPDFALDLPHLRILRVVAPCIAPLNRFNMPLLETLHITSTQATQIHAGNDFEAFVGYVATDDPNKADASSLKSVRTLHVNVSMSEKAFGHSLKAFPSLQSLTIIPGCKIGQQLLHELTVGRYRHREKAVLCPALKVLELDCYSFREWDKKERREKRVGTAGGDTIQGRVRKLADSRKKGEALERCTLIDPQGVKHEFVP